MTTIKTAEGVAEAGPDEPALAAATQREENARAAAMGSIMTKAGPGDPRTTLGREPKPWPGAPVGAVSREQAGILPTGPMPVTDEMVERGFIMGQRIIADHTLERGDIRLVLEAALTGKGLDT